MNKAINEECADRICHVNYPELADAFGHDVMGHRAFNVVVRHFGWGRSDGEMREVFLELAPWEAAKLWNAGPKVIERIMEAQTKVNGSPVDHGPWQIIAQLGCSSMVCRGIPRFASYFPHDKMGHQAMSSFMRGSGASGDEEAFRMLLKFDEHDIRDLRYVGEKCIALIYAARKEIMRDKGENL